MARILVLCVDRDDDIGKKAGIKGPLVGEESNIKAATAVIKADPSESDGNTIFEAVKTFKELKKDAVEVVTLTGHPSRGYKADKIILSQLDSILKKYKKLDGVYLVTDGSDDDQVIPIIHSRIKIISKRTLIIKQAKELEKSYYVVKQLLQEPAFARIIFGLPGIILLTVSFLEELGLKIIIFLIGLYLMLKGFGIEEPIIQSIRNFRETTSVERATFPIYLGSFLMIILSIWGGIEKLVVAEKDILIQSAAFISGFITIFTLAMVLFFFGRIGDMMYGKEHHKIKKYMMSLVTTIAIWIVLVKGANFIFGTVGIEEFILWMVFAFFASITGFNIVKKIYINRFIVKKLKRELEAYDENGLKIGKIIEISIKNQFIGIENEKNEKGKIPFSKIVLVQDDSVSVRTN